MPGKPSWMECPECNEMFLVRPDCVKRAKRKTGFWRCKACTLTIRNKTNANPVGIIREVMNGYLEIKTKSGWKRLHRFVMEQKMGRTLCDGEIVHHKDGNKKNNRIENLVLMNHGEHTTQHNIFRKSYLKIMEWKEKRCQISVPQCHE